MGLEQGVDGGIAIAVHEERRTVVVDLFTMSLSTGCGNVGSPFHFVWPAGPSVRSGVVNAAVRPCGEPSITIFTPPIRSRPV